MEIEAKYRVDDRRVFAALLTMPTLAEWRLLPYPEPERQHNTYYDTAEGRLAAQRSSLRVRETGLTRLATLKHSRGGAGALHIRDEWETPIGAVVHPRAWPASPARDHALGLIGDDELQQLFTIHNRRRRIAVVHGQRVVAELSLDEGHIAAGGRVLGFRELEVELSNAGGVDELARISALLAQQFGLPAEERGKRARGVAFLRAQKARAEPFANSQPLQARAVNG